MASADAETNEPAGRRSIRRAAFALFSLLALLGLGTVVWYVLCYHDSIPMEDMHAAELTLQQDRPFLDALWHYRPVQHRPFFPLLLYWINQKLFHSSGTFLVACNLLFTLGLAVLLSPTLRSLRRKPMAWGVGALTIALALFWPAHYRNLTWPMQVHVYLSLFALVCACRVVIPPPDSPRDDSYKRVALAGLLLFISTFSFAYGLVGWVALGGYLLVRRARLAQFVCFGVFAASAVTLYALTWSEPKQGSPLTNSSRVLALIDYCSVFIGSPFYRAALVALPQDAALLVARLIGGVGCVWTVFIALGFSRDLWRRAGAAAASRQHFLILVLLSMLGVAVATGAGRLSEGAEQALSPRYLIVPVLFWLAWVQIAAVRFRGRYLPLLVAVMGLALLVSYPKFLRHIEERAFEVDVAAVAIVMDLSVPDAPRFRRLRTNHTYATAERVFQWFREHESSVFREEWSRWPGEPAEGILPGVSATSGSAGIEVPIPVPERPGYWLFGGWYGGDVAECDLVVAVHDGRIAGIARSGRRAARTAMKGAPRGEQRGWLGFVEASSGSAVEIFGQDAEDQWRPLGTVTLP